MHESLRQHAPEYIFCKIAKNSAIVKIMLQPLH